MRREELLRLLAREAVVRRPGRRVDSGNQWSKWIMDFRTFLLSSEGSRALAGFFWDKYADQYPFQVGGMELGAVPLVSAIVAEGAYRGKPVSGFVVRKHRKKTGRGFRIEGKLGREKIILVDDLVNSGASMYGAWLAVHNAGRAVHRLFAFVHFGNPHGKERLSQTGVPLDYEFSLSEFGLQYFGKEGDTPSVPQVFPRFSHVFSAGNANPFLLTQKSAPLFEGKWAYLGGEGGWFFKIDADTGFARWRFGQIRTRSGKNIVSSPVAVPAGIVFGAYDGNVYCLDRETGRAVWVFQAADWVGSSPAYAPELGLVFIGLEHGGDARKGSCVALDAATGEPRWEAWFDDFVHCSPAYHPSADGGYVLCGSNDGKVACFRAADGALRWQLDAGAEVKASFAFDAKSGLAFFGTHAGVLHAVRLKAGKVAWTARLGPFSIYSTPLVRDGAVLCGALDKWLYHFDLRGRLVHKFETLGRIFSTPIPVGKRVAFASNDMRIYFYDPKRRNVDFFFQHSERVTAKLRYDEKLRTMYAYDFMGHLYKFGLEPFVTPQTPARFD